MKKKMFKESVSLSGADIAQMLGSEAIDAYNYSKSEEAELSERIESQKKNVMEMFKRTGLIL